MEGSCAILRFIHVLAWKEYKDKNTNDGEGGVFVLLLFLLVGCSAYSFNPIWQLCGVTISDTEENSASLYDGSEHTFVIDLDYDQSYSLDILRTEDSSIIDNYLIEFICNGEDILREYHDSGFYVLKDGSTYIYSAIYQVQSSELMSLSRRMEPS